MSELADVNLSLVNDVFIKEMVFREKGWKALSHAHIYDHQTLLASGALRVTVDGEARDYRAPKIIVVQAGKYHMMESLEPNTVAYCIHAVKGGASIDEAEPLVEGTPNAALPSLRPLFF